MSLSHDSVDKIGFVRQTCEEEIAISGVAIRLDVLLGQVRLKSSELSRLLMSMKERKPTCTIPSSSPLSLASSFLISSSTALAWFFAAEDWSFKFSDIIAAVWCAAVADSCCAV